jgi:hypothetical protein
MSFINNNQMRNNNHNNNHNNQMRNNNHNNNNNNQMRNINNHNQVRNNQTKKLNTKRYSLKQLAVFGILNKLGIQVNPKSIKDFHDAMNNPRVINSIAKDVGKLTNIVNPLIQVTTDKIIAAETRAIKQIQQNGLKTIVGAIPVVGQVIDEVDNVNRTINSGLQGVNAVTGIVTDVIDDANYAFREANPINQLNSQIINGQRYIDNSIDNSLNYPVNQLNSQIIDRQNSINNSVNNSLNYQTNKLIDGKNNINNSVNYQTNKLKPVSGGSKILSRIQKSVQEFTNTNQIQNYKNKKTKTMKNYKSMKGGLNLKQTGGQILSRINDSIQAFNNTNVNTNIIYF